MGDLAARAGRLDSMFVAEAAARQLRLVGEQALGVECDDGEAHLPAALELDRRSGAHGQLAVDLA